jgi:ribosome-associated heat shock protein Hsp15
MDSAVHAARDFRYDVPGVWINALTLISDSDRFSNGVCLERQRLDKWLWHARVVKARTSAAALIEAGHVRVNGVREKAPGHSVKAGDVVTIGLDRTVRILKVAGFAERRGNASAARVLYDDLQRGAE